MAEGARLEIAQTEVYLMFPTATKCSSEKSFQAFRRRGVGEEDFWVAVLSWSFLAQDLDEIGRGVGLLDDALEDVRSGYTKIKDRLYSTLHCRKRQLSSLHSGSLDTSV